MLADLVGRSSNGICKPNVNAMSSPSCLYSLDVFLLSEGIRLENNDQSIMDLFNHYNRQVADNLEPPGETKRRDLLVQNESV